MKRERSRWWLGAFALFLGLLVIWILAVIVLDPAGASSFSLNLGLGSRLRADYSADAVGRRIGVLRISVVEDVMRDLGMTEQEAESHQAEVEVAMGQTVPTATALDFAGRAPFTPTPQPTATPVPTEIPTDTPEPTSTETPTGTLRATSTRTRTPTPSRSPMPSGTANTASTKTRTPYPSATPTVCYVDPVVEILAPTGMPTYGVGDVIPAQAFAYDPDNVNPGICGAVGFYPEHDGAGLDRVEFEIRMGYSLADQLVYSHIDTSPPYCGFGGSGSCNTHPVSGSSWPGGQPMTSGPYTLWVRSKDTGYHYSAWDSVSFTLYLGPATPTRSPTSTSTPPPSPTPTDTPTVTPTIGVLTTDPPEPSQSP